MQLLPDPMKLCRPRATITGLCLMALCASLLAACGTNGARLIANNDEYAAYRRVRTADRLTARLAASDAYLDGYPQGQWSREVRPWFDRAELRYWIRVKETPSGLAAYLQTLPTGPHAYEAATALDVYREHQLQARRDLLDIKASMTEERLAAIALQREEAVAAFTGWIGSFLAIKTWGETTSQLDHEVIFAWRIDPPVGRCVDDRCSKTVQLPYQLPGGGESAERRLVMDIVFVLRQGMLVECRLEGAGLFSRLYEAAKKKPVVHDDVSARVDAIAYAVEVVGGAVEARMPSVACAQGAVAPVVLHRSCQDWTVTVVAAESPGDDDTVSISGPPR